MNATEKRDLVRRTSMPVGILSLGSAVGFATAARLVSRRVQDPSVAWTLLELTTAAIAVAVVTLAFYAVTIRGESQ
jgi:hypothetical protein